jgi:hypothetical protein
MLSDEDRSILQLIEVGVRPNPHFKITDPRVLGRVAAAYLSGMAGDALVESPITHFGKRMTEAIELLNSGIPPESLCGELEKRWAK